MEPVLINEMVNIMRSFISKSWKFIVRAWNGNDPVFHASAVVRTLISSGLRILCESKHRKAESALPKASID